MSSLPRDLAAARQLCEQARPHRPKASLCFSASPMSDLAATVTLANKVLHDVKHSRYFQVWALLWFASFIIFCVGAMKTPPCMNHLTPTRLRHVYQSCDALNGRLWQQVLSRSVAGRDRLIFSHALFFFSFILYQIPSSQ